MALGEAGDLGPDGDAIARIPGRVIPRFVGPPEAFGDGADPALQTMLIHRQAVDRSERPRLRLLDRSAGHELCPEAEEHILDGVGGLGVAEPEPPHEAEQCLTVPAFEIEDDPSRASCRVDDVDRPKVADG